MVCVQVLGLFTLKETYAPTLLERKAERLRKETGNSNLRSIYSGADRHWQTIVRKGLTRPFYLFWHEPIIQVFALIQMLV
jgi:hypothetical protein